MEKKLTVEKLFELSEKGLLTEEALALALNSLAKKSKSSFLEASTSVEETLIKTDNKFYILEEEFSSIKGGTPIFRVLTTDGDVLIEGSNRRFIEDYLTSRKLTIEKIRFANLNLENIDMLFDDKNQGFKEWLEKHNVTFAQNKSGKLYAEVLNAPNEELYDIIDLKRINDFSKNNFELFSTDNQEQINQLIALFYICYELWPEGHTMTTRFSKILNAEIYSELFSCSNGIVKGNTIYEKMRDFIDRDPSYVREMVYNGMRIAKDYNAENYNDVIYCLENNQIDKLYNIFQILNGNYIVNYIDVSHRFSPKR